MATDGLDAHLGGGVHVDRSTGGRLGASAGITKAAEASSLFSWGGITDRVASTFDPKTAQGRANTALFGSVLNTTAGIVGMRASYEQQKANAQYIQAVAAYNLDRERIANQAQLSSQRAAMGGSGMDMTRGSPVAALVDEAYWLERDSYARAHQEFERAKVIKREAKRELIRGYVQAGTNLLGSASFAALGGGS